MVYYCTNCWKEIKKDEKICPYCGVDQDYLNNEDFIKKLIRALDHPEPATPIRAAKILGDKNVKEAIPDLLNKLYNTNDPFLMEAIIKTILKLKPDEKSRIKSTLNNYFPVTIKKLMEK